MSFLIIVVLILISSFLSAVSLIRNPRKILRYTCIILNIFAFFGASYIAWENYKSEAVQKNSIELLVSATKATDSSRLILEKAMQEACKDSKWILKCMSSLKTDGTTSYFFYERNAPTEDSTGLLILRGGDIARLSIRSDIVEILKRMLSTTEVKLVSGEDNGKIFENIKIVLLTLAPDWEAFPSRQKGELIFRKGDLYLIFSKEFLNDIFSLENKLERNFKILERAVDTVFNDEKMRRIRKGNLPNKTEQPIIECIYGNATKRN